MYHIFPQTKFISCANFTQKYIFCYVIILPCRRICMWYRRQLHQVCTSSMVFSYQLIISTCLPWFLSSLLCYRKNTSELIRQLITACGEETTEDICDYVNRTSQAAYRGMGSAPIGEGMKTALWQLSLALVFKIIITIFTFGIKVSRKKLLYSSSGSIYMMYIGWEWTDGSYMQSWGSKKFAASEILNFQLILYNKSSSLQNFFVQSCLTFEGQTTQSVEILSNRDIQNSDTVIFYLHAYPNRLINEERLLAVNFLHSKF